MSKKDSLSWMDDMAKFDEISSNTAFAQEDTNYRYEYAPHTAHQPYFFSMVKVRAQEDKPRLTNVRVPAQTEALLKQLSPSEPLATILVALAELKASELIKDKQSIMVRYKYEEDTNK